VVAADLIAVGSSRPMNTASLAREPDPPQVAPVLALVNAAVPPWRIDTVNGSMVWEQGASMLRVPTANGNNPFALIRLMQVRLSFVKGERWGRYYEPSDLASPILDLMSVQYIISRKPPAAFPLKQVGEIPGERVFELP